MAISDKGRFPLVEAYAFAATHGLATEIAQLREMSTKFKSYNSTVRRGFVIDLFERKGLLRAFIDQVWPRGHTAAGVSEIESCRNRRHDFEAESHRH